VEEQPSPLRVLPSSQASDGVTTPSGAHVGRDHPHHVIVDPRQRVAGEPGTARHAQDQAGSIGVGEDQLHDLAAASLDEGHVVASVQVMPSGSSNRGHSSTALMTRSTMRPTRRRQDVALVLEVLVELPAADLGARADVRD
jgi:hypothetical protein